MKTMIKESRFIFACIVLCLIMVFYALTAVVSTSAKSENEPSSAKMIYRVESKEVDKNQTSPKSGYFKLDFQPILQYPELPTGCEITSLASVLNFYDCNVDKAYLAKHYLETGKIGETNPLNAFVGSPFSKNSFGCYSEVIKNSAQKYIDNFDLELQVKNVSKLDFPQLLKLTEKGQPVIFWATMNLAKPYESTVWQIDNEKVPWYAYEHCMVLIGFDYDTDKYIVSDPLNGIVEYGRELTEVRYNQIGKHAVLISKR